MYKKKERKYRKERKTRRRRKVYSKTIRRRNVSLANTPIQKSAIVKLRYVADITLDPDNAGTPVASHLFKATDLYDPDYSSGSGPTDHQPHGFDQWMQFYNHYTVIGSKITVNFISNISGVNNSWVGVGTYSDATSLTGDTHLMRENGRCIWKYLTGDSESAIKITKKFSSKSFFGTKNLVGEDSYKGTASTSPTENAYFYVMAGNLVSNNPGQIIAAVTIDYIAVLTEPKALPQS